MKAAAILQMCAYSEQLAGLQGVAPLHIHVITGDGERHTEKLSDYSAYYRALKARYEALVLGDPASDAADTYPEKVDHCGVCRWIDVCTEQWRADDHLSLVAGMRRDQTRKLCASGVCTTTALSALASDPHVDGIGDASLERLRHRAELQVHGEAAADLELLPPEPPDPVISRRVATADGRRCPSRRPATSTSTWRATRSLDGGLQYLFGVSRSRRRCAQYPRSGALERRKAASKTSSTS